ncbi:hypothetical protein, partial [Desulfamplus magnetovallimortis]|uniref:hypothetical protein n=1 Tax=Desulfamplus magnetovallimortis TaxID=1246637 RepID=UPI001C977E69
VSFSSLYLGVIDDVVIHACLLKIDILLLFYPGLGSALFTRRANIGITLYGFPYCNINISVYTCHILPFCFDCSIVWGIFCENNWQKSRR